MPLYPSWQQITLRIVLALIASFCIGLNRDERGKSAGLRTTMLVCLAATLAMLQANLLLHTSGKTPASFTVLDLERLPLGILDGIGFIGAGVILRRGNKVTGLTTAATLWIVTALGLLFGGGQLVLGSISSLITILILWNLKWIEARLTAEHSATLHLTFVPGAQQDEQSLRSHIASVSCRIVSWTAEFDASGTLHAVRCDLRLSSRRDAHVTPSFVHQLALSPEIMHVKWRI